MLWIKAFHIIFMVTWFSGLFYLPRLYVYHATTEDVMGRARFLIMERKLYYMIMTPGGVLTLLFGVLLIASDPHAWLQMKWLHLKLGLVLLLVLYHLWLGRLLRDFRLERNHHSHVFYRWINEIPAIFLILIVVLAVVKPY